MFYVTTSFFWNFFFIYFLYSTLIMSLLVYITPIFLNFFTYTKVKKKFYFINSHSITWLIILFVILNVLNVLLISTPVVSIWSNHFVVTPYHFKLFLLIFFFFVTLILVYASVFYLSSKEIYDFYMVIINFNYWIVLLNFTNSIFSVLFVIEVLTTLVILVNVASVFSSAYFYNNIRLSYFSFNRRSLPTSFIMSILFYFWTSLLASLYLYYFILFFYTKINLFDWFLIEYIFNFFVTTSSPAMVFRFALTWFFLLFTLILKCGLMPFFVWKPSYFKGISYYTIFWYITYFYLFLFIFITQLLLNYLSIIFYTYIYIIMLLVVCGLVLLNLILLETYYLKSFLAMSSILNSTYLLLIMLNTHTVNLYFWL